ncbi:MAG: putative addiction module antidote protein [Thiomicrorhabdus sp.]|nr:putative addiction module antidote protein [Thiomicrorhabdus sp.]MCF6299377.1 putative addiction module antidote protein [Thiomicrorhabdus sp.]
MNSITKTAVYNPADYLETPEDVKGYLEACLEENDPLLFIEALGVAAKSKGMASIADQTGLGRESLYKSFGAGKHPRFETVFKVVQALGLKFELGKMPLVNSG